ncbi:MAG: nitrite reductase [Gammaproteobacteria bacterium]|nr:nitrite reductase [Gammaproteobacteria bacterium]
MKTLKRQAGRIRIFKTLFVLAGIFLVGSLGYKYLYPVIFEAYTGVVNAPLTYESSQKLTTTEFEALARELTHDARYKEAVAVSADEENEFARKLKIQMLMNTPSFRAKTDYRHIDYFRHAGIKQYEGPKTCLQCHETMVVHDYEGNHKTVNTMDDILDTVHFKFQSSGRVFSTYGYDGRRVNADSAMPIPIGKINRACGVPGSFSWTGWAKLVEAKPHGEDGEVEIRSEGCGQCHIGGNYHPATEKMMPIGGIPEETKQGIDCLICHSDTYDMNQRYVIEDDYGMRWNQDRSMRAAMTVSWARSKNCLNCHQHNMGGDAYEHNVAAANLGYKNKRLLHHGAKRANPFAPEDDVHAAAGIICTDCHVPEGHKIPRGIKGTDLVSNDLPFKEVACENCHTEAPHTKSKDRVILNGHIARLACETCHILELTEYNVVLRDWVHPTWNEEEGIYTPTDVYRNGEVGKGFIYLWFNGNGTFLANALGNNPLKTDTYNPLMDQMANLDHPEVVAAVREAAIKLKETYPEIDVDDYVEKATRPLTQLSAKTLAQRRRTIEQNLTPVMNKGESKIYPFKLFNAIMYEDMGNQGPFGAMILPFDYPSYYETGDPKLSVMQAISDPIVKRMYELPFKEYMMDEFMAYFGVDEWNTTYPVENGELAANVEANWMRQMGTLMVNHGIQKDGRKCEECHQENGIINFVMLGYPEERVADLQNLPELKYLNMPVAEKEAMIKEKLSKKE